MDPHDPILWDRLETVRSEPRLREVFDAHSEEVTNRATFQEAVDQLKELVRGDPDIPAPDQGVAFVFAYLLERETAWDITEEFSTTEIGTARSLLDRRPDASTLERLFWEERRVPWWVAVSLGVHYTLIIYWLWEADIPLMRRNVPATQFDALDLDE